MPPRVNQIGSQAPPGANAEPPTPEDFLASRGLESLANRMITGHDGQPVTVVAALGSPCRHYIEGMIDDKIETVRELAGQDADVLPRIEKLLEKMGQRAQETVLASGQPEAGEK